MKTKNVLFIGAGILITAIILISLVLTNTSRVSSTSINSSIVIGGQTYNQLEKTYQPNTQTVTIKDKTLGDISNIQLLTPLDYHVGLGYQIVAEANITFYEKPDTFLNGMEFQDKNKNNQIINRNFDYKYLTTQQVDIPDYKTVCKTTLSNGTGVDCSQVKNGSHKETQLVWLPFDDAKPNKGETYTVGIFTDVQNGDKVEWIPTWFNTNITEFASWTADLNTNLTSYYKLDESSGTTVVDSVGYGNGTSTQTLLGVTGKINTAQRGTNASAKIDLASSGYNFASFSVNMWYNGSMTSDGFPFSNLVRDNSNNYYGWAIYLNSTNGNINCYVATGTGTPQAGTKNGINVNNGNWHMLTMTYDGTSKNCSIYTDGSLSSSDILSTAPTYNGIKKPALFGWYYNNGTAFDPKNPYTADELGIWNISLTPSTVTQLHNGGSGISYTTVFNYCNFSGYVKDSNGNPLVGANITITNQIDPTEYYQNITDSNGKYIYTILNSTIYGKKYKADAIYNGSLVGILNHDMVGGC